MYLLIELDDFGTKLEHTGCRPIILWQVPFVNARIVLNDSNPSFRLSIGELWDFVGLWAAHPAMIQFLLQRSSLE
jgi:hypothetical protein